MANLSKSAPKCIEENDIESAIARYEKTSKRYKEYWWETIVKIYESCKSWAKVYVIDKVTKTIKEAVQKIKRKFVEEKPSWCYWIRIKQYGKIIYNKIGTTQEKDPVTRFKQIMKKGWAETGKDGLEYEVHRIYNCGDLPPEGLESEFRAKLIKKYKGKNYIKNDRFALSDEKDEPTVKEMDSIALDYGATVYA